MFFPSSLIQYLCWKRDECNENEKPHNKINFMEESVENDEKLC